MQQQFPDLPLLEEVVGVGVDMPQHQPYPRMATSRSDADAGDSRRRRVRRRLGEETPAREFPSHLTRAAPCSAAVIVSTDRSCCTAAGSIRAKGCEELIEYFSSYVKDGGDATLALMGVKLMALPDEPFIRFAGLLSDHERLQALEAATVVVCPSPYESLSLLALEALSVGTPILVNARSAVLVEHCVRSNGGLYYADRDEFVECLKLLVRDEPLRDGPGAERRRVHQGELPLGRRARQVRAALREAERRALSAFHDALRTRFPSRFPDTCRPPPGSA